MPTGPWWFVETAAFGAFVLMLAVILSSYTRLPDTIPTHFGLDGRPDGYGGKWLLILLLIVGSMVFVLLSFVPFHTGSLNLPGPRTEANIAAAVAMIRLVKLEVMAFLAFATWSMIRTARGEADGLGRVVPPAFTVTLLATIAAGLYQSSRNVS